MQSILPLSSALLERCTSTQNHKNRTINPITRDAVWDRISQADAQLMSWFGAACELHRDWLNDIEGLGSLFAAHIPDYKNLIQSYSKNTAQK